MSAATGRTKAVRAFAPPFMEEMAASGRISGSFGGSIIVFDIPGFTALTELFALRGAEGAEELSNQINGLLGSAVEIICGSGGFVGGFAGDSITGVFPGRPADFAASVARRIHQALRYPVEDIEAGTAAKAGVCEGEIGWGIVRSADRCLYFMRGPALHDATMAQASCSPGSTMIARGGRMTGTDPPPPPAPPWTSPSRFASERTAALEGAGEFRAVTSVFLYPDLPQSADPPPGLVQSVMSLSERLGGYLGCVEVKPTGLSLLVFFGAPVSHEDDAARADRFMREVFAGCSGRVRAGVETGPVFAGIVGSSSQCTYTVLGSSVNLASRLMSRAVSGRILAGPGFSGLTGMRTVRTDDMKLRGISRDSRIAVLSPYGLPSGSAAAPAGPFVGRHAEMEALSRSAEASRSRACGVIVHLSGEAGMGKTRLVGEFLSVSGGPETLLLECDGTLQKSLGPFARFLGRQAGLADNAGAEAARASIEEYLCRLAGRLPAALDSAADDLPERLERAAQPLGSLLGLRWPGASFDRMDPRGRSESIRSAVITLFEALVLTGSRGIVFEDVQWIDGDSAALLGELQHGLAGEPLLWILTSRPDVPAPDLPLPGRPPDLTLKLGPLSPEETAGLAELLLGARPSPRLAAFLHSHSEGCPFFIEQYCSFLKEHGCICVSGRMTDLRDGVPLPRAGISNVLIARLDGLDPGLRSAVQHAAVLGRRFEIQVLAGMLCAGSVDALASCGTSEEIWYAAGDGELAFKHAMLRDAAYSMQLRSRLRDLHRKAAESIERCHPGDRRYFADLAFHLEAAGDIPGACRYLELAASFSAGNFMIAETVERYTRLTALLGAGPARARARLGMAEFLTECSRWDEAVEQLGLALEESGGLAPRVRARIMVRLARILLERGEETRGIRLLREASANLDLDEDFSLRSMIASIEAAEMMKSDNVERAAELYRQCVDLARRGDDGEQLLRAIGSLGNYYLEIDRTDLALECYEEVLSGARETGRRNLEALVLGNIAVIHRASRRFDSAEELLRLQLAISSETGNRLLECMALGNLGTVVASGDRFEESLEFYRRAVKMAGELRSVQHEAIARINLAEHCKPLGLLEEARENAEKAVRIVREKAMTHYLGSFLITLADALCDAGDFDSARSSLDEARSLLAFGDPRLSDEMDIVEAKLKAAADPEAAVALLEGVISAARSPIYVSEAAFIRWRIRGSEESLETARRACRAQLEQNDSPWRARLLLKRMEGA